MKSIKAIISDADGTLVDTLYLIRHGQYEAAKNYLTRHSIPATEIPTYEIYESHINQVVGGSKKETLERTLRLLYAESLHYLDGIDLGQLYTLLDPIQDSLAPEYVRAYPGLAALLNWIGEHELGLAVFTSGTPHDVVRNFGLSLPELNCASLFERKNISDFAKLRQINLSLANYYRISNYAVVTGADIKVSKPNPQSLLLAMKRLDVEANEVIVLGDHSVDMQAAVNAGIAMRVGITHGFDDHAALSKAGATVIINSLVELPPLLTETMALS